MPVSDDPCLGPVQPGRILGYMTVATTRVEHSGPAIRAALVAAVSPQECAEFEAEFAQALTRAGSEFDLVPAEQVLARDERGNWVRL